MARPSSDYQTTKQRVRRLIEDRLADVDPLYRTISLAIIRRFAHQHGFDAYLDPIIRDLEGEGVISVLREGKKGTIYINGDKPSEDAN